MVNLPFRPPGIYEERSTARHTPITLHEQGVVGFVGLAQRGPIDMAIRVQSVEHYHQVFGHLDPPTFLDSALRAFFQNGGGTAYVVRVAHVDPRKPGELAAQASCRLHDRKGKDTLAVHAINEGSWGNALEVEVLATTQITQTVLTLDLKKGQTEMTVKSTHGLGRGAMVRVFDDDGHEEIFTIQAVQGRVVSFAPGEAASRLHRSNAPTYVEPITFGLRIGYLGTEEVFENLSFGPQSADFFETVVNFRSNLVRIEDLASRSTPPFNLPEPGQRKGLSGGQDGLYGVTPDDFIGADLGPEQRTGLATLAVLEDVDVLCIPDLMWAAENSAGFHSLKDIEVVQHAMLSQCEALKDRFAILDVPKGHSPAAALQWRQLFDSPYGALYFPWVKLDSGDDRLVPPGGIVAGVYARCDLQQGVHRAPANEELKGVLDVAVELNDGDIGTLNHHGINCIRPFTAHGIRVWGSRTTSSDPQQRWIPVRRVTSAIIRALQRDLQWVVFESNEPVLWKKITRNIGIFFYHLWKAGYFAGRTPEESFFIKCDEENNPPKSIDAGKVVVDLGVAPVRPAEFIAFRITQETDQAGE